MVLATSVPGQLAVVKPPVVPGPGQMIAGTGAVLVCPSNCSADRPGCQAVRGRFTLSGRGSGRSEDAIGHTPPLLCSLPRKSSEPDYYRQSPVLAGANWDVCTDLVLIWTFAKSGTFPGRVHLSYMPPLLGQSPPKRGGKLLWCVWCRVVLLLHFGTL